MPRLDDPHPDRQRAQRAHRGALGRANPYLVMYALFRTGLEGSISSEAGLRQAQRFLPDNIYDALADFCAAEWTTNLLGDEVKNRYANRCPRLLGTFVKAQEVQYHHEGYNQYLWNLF